MFLIVEYDSSDCFITEKSKEKM